MSARSAVAQQRGVDEEMLDAVDQYRDHDLLPFQQAALALADSYLTSPAEMTDAVKQEVSAQLSPAQVVEVVLKLMGFSSDKAMVALGLDLDEVRTFTMD
jgi:alkylhydroperoxidase family enzyme